MSLERYRNELDRVVDDAFSDVNLRDSLEEDIRKRLALIETQDSLDRLDVKAIEEARDDILGKLDETFEDLAVERQRLEGNNIGAEDLRGTTMEAHILDGFQELGAEVQQKYGNIREYVEISIDPEEILKLNIEAYRPFLMDKERTPEKLVDHFYENITENGMMPGDIGSEDITDAIRDLYTEEEYRRKVAESMDPTRMFLDLEPNLVESFRDLEEDGSEEFVETYLEKLGELGDYASEKIKDVFPYDSPDEIFR